MARIRTIKPEFWTSEQVLNLSIPARLLFIGLWNFCDDGGNHVASERTLKAEVFPSDDIDSTIVRRMIDELLSNDLLCLYESSGKLYWHVNGWKHQKIDRPSLKLPVFNDSTIIRRTFDDHSTTEGKGKEEEGKGREGKGKESNLPAAREKNDVDLLAQYRLLESFERFWKAYPKTNCSKKEALKSWKAVKIDDLASVASGLAGYLRYLERETWQKPAHQTTWLNQRRWEVDYDSIKSSSTTASASASSEQAKADEVERVLAERRARILNAKQLEGSNAAN